MRKMNKIAGVLLAVLLLCFAAGCGDDNGSKKPNDPNGPPVIPPVDNLYPAPAGVSIDVYDGTAKKCTITTADLDKVQQELVLVVTNSSGARDYVAYPVADVLRSLNCTLSSFNQIEYADTNDAYVNQYKRSSFARAYIAIGYLRDDGDLNTGGVPRLIADNITERGSDIIQNVARITVNLIPVENEYDVQTGISIRVYEGATLKTTITTDDLNKIQQELVTVVNNSGSRIYVAYAIEDVLDCELSNFTMIEYADKDDAYVNQYEKTSFADAYIAIGYLRDDGNLNTSGVPRLIADSKSDQGADVIQGVVRITVTPAE